MWRRQSGPRTERGSVLVETSQEGHRPPAARGSAFRAGRGHSRRGMPGAGTAFIPEPGSPACSVAALARRGGHGSAEGWLYDHLVEISRVGAEEFSFLYSEKRVGLLAYKKLDEC